MLVNSIGVFVIEGLMVELAEAFSFAAGMRDSS
jgi:hypothetical protein